MGISGGDVRRASDPSSRAWFLALIGCAVAVAVQAGFSSLSDPDLPSHLALGEWIVSHRSLPSTEPFAWTRRGDPFFAYSWLAQIAFYAILRVAGPLGLHLLAGVAGAAVVLAGFVAGRAFGLRPSLAVVLGVTCSIVAFESTPFLRPQLFLHILVPLSWAFVARLQATSFESSWPLAGLFVSSALAANLHITFPVVAVPLALLLLDEHAWREPRAWLAVALTVLGWLCSPYALMWADVFRLNFEPNAITKPPAPTGELSPGFLVAPSIGLLIAALPIVAFSALRRESQRVLFGVMWLAGLLLFARLFKGLGPWWWCSIPLAVAALGRLPRASAEGTRRAYAALLVAFVAALAIPNVRLYPMLARHEGGVQHRSLPSLKAFAAEPAARWLERAMRPEARGKMLTVFNYGSYLGWRLPALSMSIDGRTIFPDSAAMPDASGERGVAYYGPYRSADLAVVPMTYPVASVLDRDSSWLRVGVASPAPWAPKAPRAGLWVKRQWWSTAKRPNAAPPSDGQLR